MLLQVYILENQLGFFVDIKVKALIIVIQICKYAIFRLNQTETFVLSQQCSQAVLTISQLCYIHVHILQCE